MWTRHLKVAIAATSVAALTACGTPQSTSNVGSAPVYGSAGTTTSSASGFGVVQSIDMVQAQRTGVGNMGLGTIAGAVVGGALGNQVGSGSGRTAATVAGAVGGGVVGNRMEQNSRAADPQQYRVSVRMDNGAIQTLVMNNAPGVQIGERVRVDNGVIVERYR